MPISVSHVFTNLIADGTNTQIVRPSDWNSAHQVSVSLAAGEVIKYVSAGLNSVSSGTIVFGSSAGNVTFGMATDGYVTASAPTGGAGGAALKGSGTYTQNTGTVEFANSNGITFGLSNNGTMTASHNGLTQQSTQPVAYSAANGSANFSTITFANSNGVSFSTGTQGVFATVKTDYQTAGAYLTTARASNDAIGLNTALTGNGVLVTANSAGLSINVPAFLTTAMQTGSQSQLWIMGNSSGTVGGTNISGTVYSNGMSLSVAAPGGGGGAAISAGANSQNTGTVNFSNANGVTFGLSNNGVMTASVAAAGGAQTGISGISAGTQMQTAGTMQFLDSNGITWGMANSSQITATVKTDYQSSNANYLTSQSNQAYSAANGSANFQTITFANSNGVSFSTGTQGLYATVATNYQSQGAYLTTARASNDAIGLNSALTANGVSVTANSSGLSLNFPAFLTTAALSGDTTKYAGVGSAITNGTMTFNTAGLSLNLSNHLTTAMLSNAVTISNINISAGTTSSNQSSIGFSNANGMSFGFSGASITGSYTVPTQSAQTVGMYAQGNTTGQSSSSTVNATSMNFSGAGIASVGMSAGTMIISVPSGGGAGDGYNIVQAGTLGTTGTTWSSLSASVFLNGSNITVSQNNSNQIVISAPATSSLSATGNFSISTNGATISMGANAVGLGSTITGNALMTLNTAGIQFNGSGLAGVGTTFNGANLSASMTMNSAGLQMSMSAAAPGGGGGYTALSLQNRQLGASTSINSMGGQNSLWLAPIRVAAPVYASTMLGAMVSYSGTITSAATAQAGQTIRLGIWAQHTDPASTSRFDTYWTGNASLTFWNSGTSSYSYAFSLAGGNTTGSSAGSNLGTANVMGVRQIILPIGSTLSTGLYIFGILNSSSSAGYSAAMSRQALVMDNPQSIGMGTMGQATNNSIGYVDGGTYLTTTGALPNTIALNQIGGVANVMPYFKIGAL